MSRRPQSARHARCAARRRQRGRCGAAIATEPVGDEPGAGATARGRRAIRSWSRPVAGSCPRPARSSSANGWASSCRTAKRCCVRWNGSISSNWSARSRCGPAKASWRTSDRASSPASARKLPARGCASCRRRTGTARRCATAPSTWKPAWWGRRPWVPRCARRPCSGIASWASCARGTRCAAADHGEALCGGQAHLACRARARERTDRRGPGAPRAGAESS